MITYPIQPYNVSGLILFFGCYFMFYILNFNISSTTLKCNHKRSCLLASCCTFINWSRAKASGSKQRHSDVTLVDANFVHIHDTLITLSFLSFFSVSLPLFPSIHLSLSFSLVYFHDTVITLLISVYPGFIYRVTHIRTRAREVDLLD